MATELVPQVPQEGIQKANQELETLKLALVEYEREAKALKVENPVTYEVAGTLLKRVRDNRKQGSWIMQPLKQIALTITTTFRQMEQAHGNKCEVIESLIEPKMVDYKRKERAAAEAEERRINEERRKEAERLAEEQRKIREKEIAKAQRLGNIGVREAERQKREAAAEAADLAKTVQTVEVAPNVPKVAGLRQRQNWTFKVVAEDLIPREFLMVNEMAIGQFVRRCKDKALAEKTIPGIVVEAVDAI